MSRLDHLSLAVAILVGLALVAAGCGGGGSVAGTETTIGATAGGVASAASPDAGPVRRIVVFKPDFVNEAAREALVKKFGGEKLLSLRIVRGVAVLLPPTAEAALKNQPGVLRIDVDAEVHALGKVVAEGPVSAAAKPGPPPQTLP